MRLFRCVLLFVLFWGVIPLLAQEWIIKSEDNLEYNCEVIRKLMNEDYADEPFLRDGESVGTLADVFGIVGCFESDDAEVQTGESLFRITVKSNVNLRDCARTSCGLVGQANPGEMYDVIGKDGKWYEINFNRGTAFIAGWLTTRLPDAIVETGEPHTIASAGCIVLPDSNRSSDMDISFVIAGAGKDNVIVDLYAPTQERALRVDRQIDKTFIDTGDPYILQLYRWNQWFPLGIYTVELQIGGDVYSMAWNVAEKADYNVHVYCE